MPKKGTKVNRVEIETRRAQAIELRKYGVSEEDIMRELGFKSIQAVQNAIRTGMRRPTRKHAEDARELMRLRYEMLLQILATRVQAGDLAAIDRFHKIMESEGKLDGVFAPIKVANTDPTGEHAAPVKQYFVVSPLDWVDPEDEKNTTPDGEK